ncbi:MAG: zinc ribbon domain-containing protein [Candidatus Omnitrophica bacterium]|nr:zinc ribbon domain-containing protein [Candidatus Omnitrophota bacterium]
MPIFEFKCKNCGNKFEELIKMMYLLESITCPHCQSKNLEKIFSKFSIVQCGRESNNETSSSTNKCSGCSASSCASCNV